MIDINELRQSLGAVQPEEVAVLLNRLEEAEKERDALRAKIEVMERQEPVAWLHETRPDAPYPGMSEAFEQHFSQSFTDREWRAESATWAAAWKAAKRHEAQAQPAPSIPEGIQRVARDFYWDSAALHHVPFVRVEFQPVTANSPNDAKGWQDRDRFFAAMLAAAPEAKP